MSEQYDFSGWATRNDLVCSDGRTIRKDAFKHNDGQTVPLVWNHNHNDPDNVLGHALLENRDEGVYAYCTFNENESGKLGKELVKHGDIRSLSIFANQLKQSGTNVIHGAIKEVSLVLAGANPGAFIDSVMSHSDDDSETGIILGYDENITIISHAESDSSTKNQNEDTSKVNDSDKTEEKEETVEDVLNTFTEKQKKVLSYLISEALKTSESENKDNKEETTEMKHNVFENDETKEENTLSHSDMQKIIGDGKRFGSLKESVLSHSDEYGIENIEYLFPDNKNVDSEPRFIQRDVSWVAKVMSSVSHTPFSRVKSIFADITEDQARAKGYIKGTLKKEEVFSLLKRTTDPTTVFKKQKIDKNDIDDVTDFNVVAMIKREMRLMLDEELARAFMFGDGRLSSDDEKISEDHIRPVVNDADLFVIRWSVASGSSDDDLAKNFIKASIKARKNYKGTGRPVLYTTEDMLANMLLLEDTLGHAIYKTESELATKLRVSEIVTVPVLENLTDKDSKNVYGIIVNMADYGVGADKGGAVNMFDDFDIDYNQMKYLIETRCSGALRVPFSAIVLRSGTSTQSEEPTMAQIKAQLNN